MDECKRVVEPEYARNLGFTDNQYDEAIKMVDCPSNHCELLKALMQVRETSTTKSTNNSNNPNPEEQAIQEHHHKLAPRTSHDSSSCYSSGIPSSASSSESLQLKKIYIDGSNVARTHGKNLKFSWLGVKLCVDWFHHRHHRVKVFVPSDKCQLDNNSLDQKHQREIINYLNRIDALVITPSGHNDDFFIIEAAKHNNGIIVSNDLYRDEKRYDDDLKEFIRVNRLPYIFVDDLFIPAEDPLGKSRRPFLDEFLRVGSSPLNSNQQLFFNNIQHRKLSRTKSHQKYTPNSNLSNGRSKLAVCRTKSDNLI